MKRDPYFWLSDEWMTENEYNIMNIKSYFAASDATSACSRVYPSTAEMLRILCDDLDRALAAGIVFG